VTFSFLVIASLHVNENFLLAASSYVVSEEVNEIGLLLIKKKEKRNKVLYQFSVYAHP
jgi:hypothetical protein